MSIKRVKNFNKHIFLENEPGAKNKILQTNETQAEAGVEQTEVDAGVELYGKHEKKNIFRKIFNTVRDAVSLLPTSVLTKYWMGGGNNIHSDNKIANEHKVTLNQGELKQAKEEAYEMFKYTTLVYAYHGKSSDLVNDNVKYKLSEDERKYIDVKTDENGKVISCINGSKIVGYLDDEKTGARAIAVQGADGKITISIAGADMTTGKKGDLKKDTDDIFAITGGNMTSQFKPVFDFAESIKEKYGKIDNIVGHSLGGQIATCLVPAFPEAKTYIYDAPGLSNNLITQMSKFYGISWDNLVNIYDNKANDVLKVCNGRNSFNTLGWMQREVTMIDPASDDYKASKIGNLVPHGHFYAANDPKGFYQSIQNLNPDNNESSLYNVVQDKKEKSNGPKIITSVMAGASLVAGTPLVVAGVVHGIIANEKENPKSLKPDQQAEILLQNNKLIQPRVNLDTPKQNVLQ